MQMQNTYWLEKVLKMILYVNALLCTLQHIVLYAMQLSSVNSENWHHWFASRVWQYAAVCTKVHWRTRRSFSAPSLTSKYFAICICLISCTESETYAQIGLRDRGPVFRASFCSTEFLASQRALKEMWSTTAQETNLCHKFCNKRKYLKNQVA